LRNSKFVEQSDEDSMRSKFTSGERMKLIQVGEGRVDVRLLFEFRLFFTELASLYARSVPH